MWTLTWMRSGCLVGTELDSVSREGVRLRRKLISDVGAVLPISEYLTTRKTARHWDDFPFDLPSPPSPFIDTPTRGSS